MGLLYLYLFTLQSCLMPFHSEPWSRNYHAVFFSGDVVAESYGFIILSVRVVPLVADGFLVPALHVYKQFFRYRSGLVGCCLYAQSSLVLNTTLM